MKAFLVGLLFLLAVAAFSAIGIVLYPILWALSIALRIILSIVLVIFAIWLLGKFIISVWEKMREKK
jgi:hypothetical protein